MPKQQPTDPATKPANDPANEQAAAAAAAEVETEDTDEAAAKPPTARGSIAGVDFEFPKKRIESIQFRRLMQQGRDLIAIEFVLGSGKFNEILAAMGDEDGLTTEDDFRKVWDAIGDAHKAATGGNS